MRERLSRSIHVQASISAELEDKAMDFMNLTERAAYLKGLSEGLDLDKSKPEGKLIDAMLELIYDMADEISGIEDEIELLNEETDNINEILSEIDDDYDDDFDDYDDFENEPEGYEVHCPDCDLHFIVDEDTLIEGEINCPGCGAPIEFDFSALGDYCDGDCNDCASADNDCEGISF